MILVYDKELKGVVPFSSFYINFQIIILYQN